MKKIIILFYLLCIFKESSTAQIIVTVTPPTPINICGTGSVNLFASQLPAGYSYQWHKTSTVAQGWCSDMAIPGAVSNFLQVTSSGFYYVEVLDQNFQSVTVSYPPTFVKKLPEVVPISSDGPPNNCQANYISLCVGQHWEDYYLSSSGVQWMRDGVDIQGADESYYYANAPGVYKCRVHNSCATGYSDSIVITSILPTASITPPGTTTFCANGNVLLNANTGNGLIYQWKKNGAVISGATNSSYSAIAAGSYTVVVTNSCGSATSSATAVTVNSLPSATITPAGPTTFCSGGSVVLNAPVAANRNYQWKKGGNLISGATLSSYTATTGGNYRVIVTNTITGCSKTTTNAIAVTVYALPSATITPQGPTTFCAGGSVVLSANTGAGLTYKWKKNNVYISGATQSSYTATTAGVYKTVVTKSNGCSKTSVPVTVTVPCREGVPIAIGIDVNVFPNPSSGDFVFEIENATKGLISLNIYDMIGKLVFSQQILNPQFTIRNSQLSPGVYTAVFTARENKKTLKLIKTN